MVRKQLIERANDFNIILEDVSLAELSFSHENAAAVETKQIVPKEAQTMNVVGQKKQELHQRLPEYQFLDVKTLPKSTTI